MGALKKRPTAFAVALVVIVFGTLFGVHRSVGAQTRKIEAMFYNGVYIADQNYTQPGIGEQLAKRETAALGLVTVANHYDALSSLTESLREARVELMDAGSIADKYAANEKMQTAYEALYAELTRQDLTDSEKAASEDYAATLNGAEGAIQTSAYNDEVSSFRRELGSFPVNILKNLAFVTLPEYFGAED
jgi:hypothetical protein